MDTSEDLDRSKVVLAHKVRDLHRYLRQAVIGYASDCFLDQTPLQKLGEAAKTRDTSITTKAAENFEEHARKLTSVSFDGYLSKRKYLKIFYRHPGWYPNFFQTTLMECVSCTMPHTFAKKQHERFFVIAAKICTKRFDECH